MNSTKRLARTAGVLYLINGILAGFAFGYVISKVYVGGNAAATAANVAHSAGLVRAGAVADMVQATEWVFLAMALYLLLKHVNHSAAKAMVVFVAVGAAITCLNDVFQVESVRVATEGSYAALGAGTTSAMVLLLLDIHHYGFLIAQIFFGLWLMPLGYLAYKSAMFPKVLGLGLIVGGCCYMIGMLAVFLIPDAGEKVNTIVTIPSTIAELSMVGYLLLMGVRTPKTATQAARAIAA